MTVSSPKSNRSTFARCEPFAARTTSVGATAVKRRAILDAVAALVAVPSRTICSCIGRMDGCGHGGSFRRKPNVGAPEAAEALRRNVHYQRIVAHAAVAHHASRARCANRCDLETGFREKASGAELCMRFCIFSTSWQNRRSATRALLHPPIALHERAF